MNFTGNALHALDEKNRIFVPSKMRAVLGERYYITKGFDRCLNVFSESGWNAFCEKITALPMVKNRREREYFFSNASEGTLDSQGRIVISGALCEYAGFDREVKIIGSGSHIELWSNDEWSSFENGFDPQIIANALIDAGL